MKPICSSAHIEINNQNRYKAATIICNSWIRTANALEGFRGCGSYQLNINPFHTALFEIIPLNKDKQTEEI